MGFSTTENAYYGYLPVFEALGQLSMMYDGYAYIKIFYSWNSVTLGFEGHICKIMSFEDTYCALSNFFPKVFILFLTSIASKSDNYRYENTEIKSAQIRKKIVIYICLLLYRFFCLYLIK